MKNSKIDKNAFPENSGLYVFYSVDDHFCGYMCGSQQAGDEKIKGLGCHEFIADGQDILLFDKDNDGCFQAMFCSNNCATKGLIYLLGHFSYMKEGTK